VVLLASPTLRQSGLLLAAVAALWRSAGRPVPLAGTRESVLTLRLSNGSQVVSLPGASEATVRGYAGVDLLVFDEAARCPDSLYRACRPMLAVSGGRLVALSSAFCRSGWFYEAWTGGDGWERYKVTADQCPRIAPAFLAEERAALGARWYAMEYECEFCDLAGALFSRGDIDASMRSDLAPLFGA
jgi:hypothetical protein